MALRFFRACNLVLGFLPVGKKPTSVVSDEEDYEPHLLAPFLILVLLPLILQLLLVSSGLLFQFGDVPIFRNSAASTGQQRDDQCQHQSDLADFHN